MERNTAGLREALFQELEAVRNGTSDPVRAQAVAKLSSQIISTARVEMEFHKLKMKAEKHGAELALGAMNLGSYVEPAALPSSERNAHSGGATASETGSQTSAPSAVTLAGSEAQRAAAA